MPRKKCYNDIADRMGRTLHDLCGKRWKITAKNKRAA